VAVTDEAGVDEGDTPVGGDGGKEVGGLRRVRGDPHVEAQ
jgi:hypothetical protein